MTVAEIKRMVENMEDNQEVIMVTEKYDRDGYPYEAPAKVIAIVPNGTKQVNVGYGIMRYERKGVEEKK